MLGFSVGLLILASVDKAVGNAALSRFLTIQARTGSCLTFPNGTRIRVAQDDGKAPVVSGLLWG